MRKLNFLEIFLSLVCILCLFCSVLKVTANSDQQGIDVTRSYMIEALRPLNFNFEKGVPVYGEDNYVGVDNDSTAVVQLLGPAENLTSASILAWLAADHKRNLTALTNFISLADIIDSTSFDWIMAQLDTTGEDASKSYAASKDFGQRNFKYAYDFLDVHGQLTLMVTPVEKRRGHYFINPMGK